MNVEEMIKAARPADDPDWADRPQGQQLLHRVLAVPRSAPGGGVRRRWVRTAMLAGAGLVAVGGAAGAAVAVFAPEPPPGWQVPGSSVACAAERAKDADLSIRAWQPGEDPVAVCRQDWIGRTGTAPDPLFSCVFKKDGSGGGVIVIPGGGFREAAQACETVGMFVAPARLTPAPPATNIPPRPSPGGGE